MRFLKWRNLAWVIPGTVYKIIDSIMKKLTQINNLSAEELVKVNKAASKSDLSLMFVLAINIIDKIISITIS
jgi:hypothetical protein